jgi:AraC-like DNA-binding protein
MLYLLGVSLSIFLFLILISKKGKTLPDKILAVWLIFLGLNIFHYYLAITDLDLNYPFLLALGSPLPLIQGPFLFLYTAALTNQFPNKKYKMFLHFMPLIIIYIVFIPFYMLDNQQKLEVYLQHGKGWEFQILTNLILIYLSGIVYVAWSLFLLRKHRKNILQQFSDIEKINLNWLRYLIIGMSSIWLFVFYGNDDLIYGSVVLFVAFIGYYGIKQVGIFTSNYSYNNEIDRLTLLKTENEINITNDIVVSKKETEYSSDNSLINSNEQEVTLLSNQNQSTVELDISISQQIIKEEQNSDVIIENIQVVIETKKKYLKSGLSDLDALTIHKKLTDLMSSEKTFKNPELTLVELAQLLNVHPNILSQIINSIENKNFYDYINDKRVEEFKSIVILPKNQKYTLLSLALECGFNSKTTFNRNFKKSTGVSPSEYLKNIHVEIKK